jgi:pyridine nucleotide-disulfide oxidoreductase family protein
MAIHILQDRPSSYFLTRLLHIYFFAATFTTMLSNIGCVAAKSPVVSSKHLAFASSILSNNGKSDNTKPRLKSKLNQQSQQNESPTLSSKEQHLVLIGGGHAHVQVLKAIHAGSRPAHLRVTLIDTEKSASYSGMVPGCIAGAYDPDQTLLHLVPLCDWASIDFIQDRVTDIDLDNKRIYLQKRQQNQESDDCEYLSFDAVSMDVGSTSRDIYTIPGAAEHTIPTRPIHELVERLEVARKSVSAVVDAQKEHDVPAMVIIGGGAAGIELSLSITSRWKKTHAHMTCTLLDAGKELLPQESDTARKGIHQVLTDHGVTVQHECKVQEITSTDVILNNGQHIPFTHCIWATGAGAQPLVKHLQTARGLECSDHGWIQVEPTFQSTSHPFLFAAGDCANIVNLKDNKRSPPKAGVFAVRAGPILIENLTRYLEGRELKCYEPQDDFLKLIGCGDGQAFGFRFGLSMRGSWVWKLKSQIDCNFMKLFDVTDLAKPVPGSGTYDTSQYDDADAAKRKQLPRLEPAEAAALLLRTDDNVDHQIAWHTLRSMGDDASYRKAVLEYAESSVTDAATLQLQSPQ